MIYWAHIPFPFTVFDFAKEFTLHFIIHFTWLKSFVFLSVLYLSKANILLSFCSFIYYFFKVIYKTLYVLCLKKTCFMLNWMVSLHVNLCLTKYVPSPCDIFLCFYLGCNKSQVRLWSRGGEPWGHGTLCKGKTSGMKDLGDVSFIC
jgi:hypothetical protein